MASLTDFARNKINDALWRGQALSAPTTLYFALTTTVPTRTVRGTEVSGGSYARVGVAASLANFSGTQSAGSTVASSGTTGQSSNNILITWPTPTADWTTIRGVEIYDAPTGGNCWAFGSVTAIAANTTTQAPKIAIGASVFSLDN